MAEAKYKIERKCPICGELFFAKTLDSVYCSRQCGKVAYARKKKEEKKENELKILAEHIAQGRDLISIPEAEALYAVHRRTLYRLIRSGEIPSINLGQRLIRIDRHALQARFEQRAEAIEKKDKPLPKTYRLEPEDCYTIGEISKKYRCSESTVYGAIRKNGIPIRQLGKFVYAPKTEIDAIFKSVKK